MNRNKTERIISELPNILKWNTSTRGHKESTKIESNSLECNGTMYVIKIDGDTRKYDLSAIGMSDTSHEWLVQLEGLEYGTDIFYYLHDRAAQEANMKSDFLAEPSRRILSLLTGMENMPPKLEFGVAPALVWVMTESVSVEEIIHTTLVGSPRMYRITHHKPPLNLTKDRHWKLEVQDLEDPFEWMELNNCSPVEDLQHAAQKHFNKWFSDQDEIKTDLEWYDGSNGFYTTAACPIQYRIQPYNAGKHVKNDKHWQLETKKHSSSEWEELYKGVPVELLKEKAQEDYNIWLNNQPAGFIVETGMQGKPQNFAVLLELEFTEHDFMRNHIPEVYYRAEIDGFIYKIEPETRMDNKVAWQLRASGERIKGADDVLILHGAYLEECKLAALINYVEGQAIIEPVKGVKSHLEAYAGKLKEDLDKMIQKNKSKKAPSILVDGNPKTQFGVVKPAAWYVPGVALFKAGLAHMHGALKYGHFNWRDEPMSSSVLINAALRHMFAWKEGEDCAQDSGIDHLAHAAACLNILMDAQHHGNLNDDRHDSVTDFNKLFEESKPIIKQIESDAAALHASKPTNNEE